MVNVGEGIGWMYGDTVIGMAGGTSPMCGTAHPKFGDGEIGSIHKVEALDNAPSLQRFSVE